MFNETDWEYVKEELGFEFRPQEFKILIRVDQVQEARDSIIIIPDTVKDREYIAQDMGTIVVMSPCACSETDIWGPKEGRPKQGDRVIFSKHAGAIVKKLGKEYRLIQDKDLGAVMEGNDE